MISVYQVYFNEETKKYLETGFIPYENKVKDGYFENTVIKDIYKNKLDLHSDDSYIGITSWQQSLKTNLTSADILSHIQSDIIKGTGKDVYLYPPIPVNSCHVSVNEVVPEGYSMNGIIKAPDLWERHHGRRLVPEMDKMLNNSKVLPFDIYDGKWVYSECNYWIVKKHVFVDYCKNVLIPAIEYFERPTVKAITPVCFEHHHEKKKYANYAFTLEALFGSFLAHSAYSYSYIYNRIFPRHQLKRINILQYERTE